MGQMNFIPGWQFSTINLRQEERYDAWRHQLDGLLDFGALDEENTTYDAMMGVTQVGEVAIGRRTWLGPAHRTSHRVWRDSRRIRRDGIDYYYLQLQLGEVTRSSATGRDSLARTGDMFLMDMALESDNITTPGDAIYLMIPRHILPGDLSGYHSRILINGMTPLLADYVRSLHARSSQMSTADASYAGQATAHLLRACLQPSKETLAQAQTELGALQMRRVKNYIDTHLFDQNLSIDLICKEVGISRSSLYRLFEINGGVGRMILQSRLRRAHDLLVDSTLVKIRISEIADRHGFSSEKYFSKVFKEVFGYTPREARERHILGDGLNIQTRSDMGRDATFSNWMLNFLQL